LTCALWLASVPVSAPAPGENAKHLLKEADRLAWVKNWAKARPLFVRAEKLFAEAGDDRNALYAKIGRLRGEWETLPFPEVSQYLAEQLENPLVQNDPQLKLRLLEAKGALDLEIDPSSARQSWEQVRDLAKKLGDKARASRADGELGIIAFLEGDSSQAVELVGTALANSLALKDAGAHIRYLNLMGNGLVVFGRPEEAIRYFDRALETARRHPDLGTSVMALTGKARALLEIGDTSKARKLVEDSLGVVRRHERRGNEAELMALLADIEEREGNAERAIWLLKEAASLADQGKFHRLHADAMFQLARLYRDSGDLETAQQRAADGLASSRRLGDVYSLPEHTAILADLQTGLGRLQKADALYEQAADILDGMLVKVGSRRAKTSLVAARSEIYIEHFRLLLEEIGDFDRAFQTLERARGRTIADVLRAPEDQNRQKPTAERRTAERRISQLQFRLMQAEDRDERKKLLEELFQAEQALVPLTEKHNRNRIMLSARPVEPGVLQRTLSDNELLLEYVLADPVSYCLVISKDKARVAKLPRRTRIENLVAVYLAEARSKKPTTEVAQVLYSILLAPIHEHKTKSRLVIVPDGKLHMLPFDALRNPKGKRYVLDSHTVSYVPSATALHLLRASPPQTTPKFTLLAVGGVQHPDTVVPPASANGRGAMDAQNEPALRGVYDLEGANFSSLPSTADEVASVAETVGNKSMTLLAERATESVFRAQPLDKFTVVHLAVHGIADAEFPDRAALVLAADAGTPDDGLLQSREIINLNVRVELVTLSACDTAVGRLQGQEGVASLVRAFLLAGARSVVASLWAADDVFTTALMKRFYQHLANGTDRAAALRKAKLDLLERFGENAAPFYWAGFTLTGVGFEPIEFEL